MASADGSDNAEGTGKIFTPVVIFIALSLYNVVELNVIIFTTFKSRKSLYFWSFLAATNGIAPHSIGFLLKQLLSPDYFVLFISLVSVGWVLMVTGQSLVLYSRLHLILRNPFYLKLVLGMIITNAIVLHVPIIILMFGANSPQAKIFEFPYSVYEKIQVTVFSLQEILISLIYLKACASFFEVQGALHGSSVRRIRNHLWMVNVVVILLDIPILVLEYANLYVYQTAYKALVYSIKLKLEFRILNQLIEVTKNRDHNSGSHRLNSHRGVGTKDAAAIHMETFKGADGNHGNMSTSQAYAYGSDDGRQLGKAHPDNGVLMTTEIVVHRLKRMDDDSDSADRKSSTGGEHRHGTRRAVDASSKTSSEINLTREY
ncbi:integral membrane protein [Purpureocillium lilacinum]|uniref:Integral membrane protein n=1 Tax=Purpureocillium lilacinum TaxID=33203 RepID=A0A179GJ74_PURLI|nr:integral membrane protein [Purpureocillium lilacinum]OAQ77916.1 integral membrane protein [Purpureocillium lilacinum]GJN80070.1 hypothetical protein PLIIFM63780_003594 [Purpureocillium lilacinum]